MIAHSNFKHKYINTHILVQCNNPLFETNAEDPLICMRPFSVTRISCLLLTKESPCVRGSKPKYSELCYSVSSHSLLVVSLQNSKHKSTLLTKTLCQQCYGKTKQPCGNVYMWSSHLGSVTCGQWVAKYPGRKKRTTF